MPRNPLLGIPEEEKETVDNGSEAQADETEEGVSDEEIEETEDASDEDGSEEEEAEDEKPAAKERKAPAKASKKAAKSAQADAGLTTGTLGDARIDTGIPMSAKAKVYFGLLLQSPLVTSIIPPDVLNEDSEHTFCINSLRIIVPKGKMVEVPFMLAQEIKQSFSNRF
jgi:hypothetical protein